MTGEQIEVCMTCGYVPKRIERKDGSFFYEHTGPDDHPVIPVPMSEVLKANIKCDFCDVVITDEIWTLPVENYEFVPGHLNIGSWAVCAGCLPFLQSGDWKGLTDRVMKSGASFERDYYRWFYGSLMQHILGPPYPGVPTR